MANVMIRNIKNKGEKCHQEKSRFENISDRTYHKKRKTFDKVMNVDVDISLKYTHCVEELLIITL